MKNEIESKYLKLIKILESDKIVWRKSKYSFDATLQKNNNEVYEIELIKRNVKDELVLIVKIDNVSYKFDTNTSFYLNISDLYNKLKIKFDNNKLKLDNQLKKLDEFIKDMGLNNE